MTPHLAAIVTRPPLTDEQQAEHAKLWRRVASHPFAPRPAMAAGVLELRVTGKHVHDYAMVPGRALAVCIQCGVTMTRITNATEKGTPA